MVDSTSSPETPAMPPSESAPRPPARASSRPRPGSWVLGGRPCCSLLVGLRGLRVLLSGEFGQARDARVTAPHCHDDHHDPDRGHRSSSPRSSHFDDNLTFRNIFRPHRQPAGSPFDTSNTTASTAASDTSGATFPADTLVLTSIASESGELVATFSWNGTLYPVHKGDVVGRFPVESARDSLGLRAHVVSATAG